MVFRCRCARGKGKGARHQEPSVAFRKEFPQEMQPFVGFAYPRGLTEGTLSHETDAQNCSFVHHCILVNGCKLAIKVRCSGPPLRDCKYIRVAVLA